MIDKNYCVLKTFHKNHRRVRSRSKNNGLIQSTGTTLRCASPSPSLQPLQCFNYHNSLIINQKDDEENFIESILPYISPLNYVDRMEIRVAFQQVIVDFLRELQEEQETNKRKTQTKNKEKYVCFKNMATLNTDEQFFWGLIPFIKMLTPERRLGVRLKMMRNLKSVLNGQSKKAPEEKRSSTRRTIKSVSDGKNVCASSGNLLKGRTMSTSTSTLDVSAPSSSLAGKEAPAAVAVAVAEVKKEGVKSSSITPAEINSSLVKPKPLGSTITEESSSASLLISSQKITNEQPPVDPYVIDYGTIQSRPSTQEDGPPPPPPPSLPSDPYDQQRRISFAAHKFENVNKDDSSTIISAPSPDNVVTAQESQQPAVINILSDDNVLHSARCLGNYLTNWKFSTKTDVDTGETKIRKTWS